MSQKTVIIFSLWTSVLSAIFYHFYSVFCSGFNVPWVMFVCMAIFFGMGMKPKQTPAAILCAFCGMAWGQIDFLLIGAFTGIGLSMYAASFLSIVIGTVAAMYLHLKPLANTPFGHMPYIFAGVCLTFSQGGKNVIGLGSTFVIGIVLAALCTLCLNFCLKKFPLEEKDKEK